MVKCINCGKSFESKEIFIIAEQYDTGVCITCQTILGEKKFKELVYKEYGQM